MVALGGCPGHRQARQRRPLAPGWLPPVWRWKSRPRTPAQDDVSPETKALIRQMAKANTSWGAPRIHGELLKLGIDINPLEIPSTSAVHLIFS
jgi:hypothetical protein